MAVYSHNSLDVTTQMTANNAPSPYVCSASSEYNASYPAWKAFDHDGTTSLNGWISVDGNAFPATLTFDCNTARTINSYTITHLTADGTAFAIGNFKLQGSANGSDWTDLDTQTGITWSQGEMKTFTLGSPATYRYFQLYITTRAGGATDRYCEVSELELIAPPTSPNLFFCLG